MLKTGLIMEGGAMRGMFTCGVIDVLLEQDIRFDGAGGISAGATFGCNFKSRQAGRALRYNLQYGRDPRYMSLRSLLFTGDLYGADFCYRVLPDELDVFDRAAFRANPMPFYVGATDVDSGEAVYHTCLDGGDTDFAWIRASASMPLVSRVVRLEGRRLLDGGIVDATPYPYMRSLGYNRNLVVLTRPAGYRKRRSRLLPLLRLSMWRYPKLYEAMALRPERYNRHIEAIEAAERRGEALVIRPREDLGIRRTENDPDALRRVYALGRRQALDRLDEIRAFLERDTL